MDIKQKMEVCRRLAKRFRRSDLLDDLVQEGLVAMLESEQRGNTHQETLRMDARLAMQNFISLKQSAVSIPATRHTRRNAAAIRKGKERPVEDMEPNTYNSLKTALEASTELTDGIEGFYESKIETTIWVKDIGRLMKARLSSRHYQIYLMRYGPLELTQQEASDRLGMSVAGVKKAEAKIKSILAMLKKLDT